MRVCEQPRGFRHLLDAAGKGTEQARSFRNQLRIFVGRVVVANSEGGGQFHDGYW